MRAPAPIHVAERFAPLRERLLDLLDGLTPEDWLRPTAAGQWTVHDVVAHLAGGDLGNLSRRRDAYTPPWNLNIDSYAALVALINDLNATWVKAAERLSPRVLRELLAFTAPAMEGYFCSLDPDAMGGPVDWAGPEAAPVWLDIAREFTEQWHHQQQIRDATGKPALDDPYYLQPVIDAFARALPHHYRGVAASEGTEVRVEITGAAGGEWSLVRGAVGWTLWVGADGEADASITVDQDTAWRLFTRGMPGAAARERSAVRGAEGLVGAFFGVLAVLA